MPSLKGAEPPLGGHLKPSAFITQHSEFIAAHLHGPIADVACGSGRNLLPFLDGKQSIDCYDIRTDCLDPHITAAAGGRLTHHPTDLLGGFHLPRGKYGLVLLVHFYAPSVLGEVVQALKPGGFLLIETIDDRGGNHHQLPRMGEVFEILAPSVSVLACQAKLAASTVSRQIVKLIGRRRPE